MKTLPIVPAIVLFLSLPTLAQGPCEVDKLYLSGGAANDSLGESVDIEGDVAIVGAPGADVVGDDNAGRAGIYEYTAGGIGVEAGWYQTASLRASDPLTAGFYANDVAVSGLWAMVGRATSDASPGSVYCYRQSGGSWPLTETERLYTSHPNATNRFGGEVAMEGDYAIVTDWRNGTNGADAGSAHVYRRFNTPGPNQWFEQQTLLPADGAADAWFGISVAMEGDLAVIGAPNSDNLFFPRSGAAYVFRRTALAGWVQEQRLTAPQLEVTGRFGTSVDIQGGRILVGNERDPGKSAKAYLFEPNIFGTWSSVASFDTQDEVSVNVYGATVAIHGNRIAIGGHFDDPSGPGVGAAWVWSQQGGNWHASPPQAVLAHDGETNDYFGHRIALSGDHLAVGAWFDADFGSRTGAAYFFDLSASLCGLPHTVPISTGGEHAFELDAGAVHGGQLYVIVGTTAGNAPGLVIDGLHFPINFDGPGGWYIQSLLLANSPGLPGSIGFLDASGDASAKLVVFPGLSPNLAGLRLSHAYLVFNTLPQTGATGSVLFASNPVDVTLVP